ncbi:MAG: PD-(D/E)XK nuclease family protein [Flavobacteriaceae bacterium]|nr:PD-(D/E)XK nuclease family protein [Flavobacteriaceae bacterium]
MLTFLEETILSLRDTRENLSKSILILPSKRAGGFVKNYLRKHLSETQFAPKIISIEEFIEELSGLKILPADELLIKSYQAYLNTQNIGDKESFLDFLSWATALLNDFSEIDRYLVDPKSFFDYLSSIKTLEKWGATEESTPLIKNYLAFWKHLSQFYKSLNEMLLAEQVGYQGMVYRKAAEDIEHYLRIHGGKDHVFIGFNALNLAEQRIIQELLENGTAQVFWDADRTFMDDDKHSASIFLRKYLSEWKYFKHQEESKFGDHFSQPKEFKIVSAQNNITQVKYLGNLLSKYTEEQLDKTAIVLAEESLLTAVLYSLPPNVQRINVTMGMKLNTLPATLFFGSLLKLHSKKTKSFYYQSVLDLLSSPIASHLLEGAPQIMDAISEQNRSRLSQNDLFKLTKQANHEALNLLFGDWMDDGKMAINNCFRLLSLVETKKSLHPGMEQFSMRTLQQVFLKFQQLVDSYPYLNTVTTIYNLYQQTTSELSMDFEGDAYDGLQIMGVLETRGLDFENLIMLSVNEGILPAGKSQASFITYDLKKQFGLPLYTDKDAIYSYHFYRLLHRVKRATFLYNNAQKGLSSGEKSRFLLQLEIEKQPAHKLAFEVISPEIQLHIKDLSEIEKTGDVMDRLKEIAGKYFSPSALAAYIRNPVDFYMQKILKVSEADEVEEIVAYKTLGNIVHNALENLYKPCEGKLLTPELLDAIKPQIQKEVIHQFKDHFKEGSYKSGKNLIVFEVVQRYIENLVAMDRSLVTTGNRIELLKLEAQLRVKIELPELDFPVFIGGQVDRIDLWNGELRVIDYKTGHVKQSDLEVVDWSSLIEDYKYSKAFQVLTYALIIRSEVKYDSMEAGVISFKNLNSGFLKFAKKERPGRSPKIYRIDKEVLETFGDQLKKLILEICDPKLPFVEKELE